MVERGVRQELPLLLLLRAIERKSDCMACTGRLPLYCCSDCTNCFWSASSEA